MSTVHTSPAGSSSTDRASRIPAAVGFVADAAGVVAFLLAGVKVIALVFGTVAVLLGLYLIARRWNQPFRLPALVAVLILAVGTALIGGVVGHQFPTAHAASGATGPGTPVSSGSPTPGSPATSSPGSTPNTAVAEATPSDSPSASESALNSPVTPMNLGDSRQGRLTNANGFGTATEITINARTFTYGLSGCHSACSSATSDFNLGRSYSTLTARLGVLDSSRAGASAHIQILADGNVVESRTVQLGTSFDIRISVKNVLRLQFVESNEGGVVAAVGDPTVTP